MRDLSDGYTPIPDWPGYYVNRLGQVCSEYGILSCDSKGRVRLRNKTANRQGAFYTGELMALAGLLVEPGQDKAEALMPDAESEVLALHEERDGLLQDLAKAERIIKNGRRLNAILMSRLSAALRAAPAPKRKKTHKSAPSLEGYASLEDVEPLNFDDLAWCRTEEDI